MLLLSAGMAERWRGRRSCLDSRAEQGEVAFVVARAEAASTQNPQACPVVQVHRECRTLYDGSSKRWKE